VRGRSVASFKSVRELAFAGIADMTSANRYLSVGILPATIQPENRDWMYP
jgi:hypothetical protein